MSEVRVSIGGHQYRVAAEAGSEERMVSLAAELDRTIGILKARLGAIGDRSLAVVAGLTVLDRMRELEAENRALAVRVAQLERAREEAVLAAEADDPALVETLTAAAEAIERLTAMITGDLHALAAGGERPVKVARRPAAAGARLDVKPRHAG